MDLNTQPICFVRYRSHEEWRLGVERSGSLVDLSEVSSSSETSLRRLLELTPHLIDECAAAAARAFDSRAASVMELGNFELGPPIHDPEKILCLGLNYREHAAEASLNEPTVPLLFTKLNNCLVGSGGEIQLPTNSVQVDYEGELAVVIGRKCKDVTESAALSCVAGYSVINDVSARDIQLRTSQWTAGKVLDTFAPLGPALVPATQVPDPQGLQLTTRLNGLVMQQASTNQMIFKVSTTIAFLSSLMTLQPGDIIATGTPSGVGVARQPQVFLAGGDIIEVEISNIGLLRNPVRAAPATIAA